MSLNDRHMTTDFICHMVGYDDDIRDYSLFGLVADMTGYSWTEESLFSNKINVYGNKILR